ncbi:hypothetical protein CDAR_365251 [Caerostris darwini]|uniref:Uncharacterized protein n=1 Tax=Caerostris darwini TaxID=1538125 RepID=A0AAV4U8H9_9ARAC|nr:hypothetical protein CDAR_365251 [Caerostris darwini]
MPKCKRGGDLDSEPPLNTTLTAFFQLRQSDLHLQECCYTRMYHHVIHVMQQDESFDKDSKEPQSKIMKESSRVTWHI